MIARCASVNSISVGGVERQRRGVGGVEGDPAVAAADRARTRPRDLAGGEQFVEHRRLVVADPRWPNTSGSTADAGIGTPAS